MRPIPWNKAFRKKDGSLVNMEDIGGGGGGSELPEHSAADAGKVLGVDENGDLAWESIDVVNQFSFASSPNSASTVVSNATEGGN